MVILKFYGRNERYMVPKTLANALKFMGEMTCTEMDIKMKNFYLDLFQSLNVGAFTGYVTFEKI